MPANNLSDFKNLSVACQRRVCSGWAQKKVGKFTHRPAKKQGGPLPSTLPLLVAGLGADHADHAIALDDLALAANALDRCSHFHWYISS
jgi:hypothetical protein